MVKGIYCTMLGIWVQSWGPYKGKGTDSSHRVELSSYLYAYAMAPSRARAHTHTQSIYLSIYVIIHIHICNFKNIIPLNWKTYGLLSLSTVLAILYFIFLSQLLSLFWICCSRKFTLEEYILSFPKLAGRRNPLTPVPLCILSPISSLPTPCFLAAPLCPTPCLS